MRFKATMAIIGVMALTACNEQESAQASSPCGPSPTSGAVEQGAPESATAKVAEGDDIGSIVTQMSWNLCNARASGWVDDTFYREESIALRQAVFAKMGVTVGKTKLETEMETPSDNDAIIE